jgi:hypothetical protein
MSWTYAGPSTSNKDAVRFLVGDTDSTAQLLSDEEITYLLTEWMPRYDSVVFVASVAADQIATHFAGLIDVSADGVSVSTSQLSARYAELAARLRTQYKSAQVGAELDLSNLMSGTQLDEGIAPLVFGMGLHDNPHAGQQSYGGRTTDPWEQAERRASGY